MINNYFLDAYINKDKETGLYIGIIQGLPGAHTQAGTLDELYSNLKEVIELCIEELTEDDLKKLPEFVGIQRISITK